MSQVAATISTEELARRFGVRPATIHAAVCRKGHYCGLRPKKLANRRLAWADIDPTRDAPDRPAPGRAVEPATPPEAA